MKNTKKKIEQPTPSAAPLYQNRVTLVGYLGHAPERVNGHAVLSLATKTSWKDKTSGEWQSRTEWHRVIAWGALVEAVKSFATGEYVLVEGELKSSEYEREVVVIGTPNKAIVLTRSWEIRARAIRRLVPKPALKKAA
ncbi:MAG: single-stranded DNA-binding protein [Bryobacterales bacterium]|nr:single-stranded DNA-binding protein [Bryobacterales bacterium]